MSRSKSEIVSWTRAALVTADLVFNKPNLSDRAGAEDGGPGLGSTPATNNKINANSDFLERRPYEFIVNGVFMPRLEGSEGVRVGQTM